VVGGAEVAIKEITDRISPADIEFHMVTLRIDSNLPAIEKIGNVLVYRIGFTAKAPSIGDLRKFPLHLNKHYFQVAAYFKARELHKKYHYDGIWAMMAHSCAIPAGLFKNAFPEVPYLLTLQEGDPPEHIEKIMKPVWPLFKQGFTSADALQSISTFLQLWGERMGFKGQSVVIPNGVDVARFARAYSAEEIQSIREKLGKKDRDVFLVTTSRLYYKNAVDDVIRALSLLPENISFLIYGIGPDETKLRALAKECSVESRARFMGHITHEMMPLAMKACDIFIRPSRSEGMGNSFIEAMALGLPVVATQEGGIADFLFDAKRNPEKPTTGWAVNKDSPEQIAEAVKGIIAHPEQVSKVTRTASAMVTEKYDWNTVADSMQKLFKGIFDGHPKTR
jgi:glycosyltransferase involved in cell wall biosynthesis